MIMPALESPDSFRSNPQHVPDVPLSPGSGASSGMSAAEALAMAKTHFVARGWRPLAIHPPLLDIQCSDVSVVLLMSEAGATAWLSARDWWALPNPVDAFRREMICVRDAKVQDIILVYDGEFPDTVIEVAVQEPGLKLVDAVALRDMAAAGAGVSSGSIRAPRRHGIARPARDAVASLHAHATRMFDTRVIPATERLVSKRLARTLQQMDGERRRLRHLVTGGLIVMGFAIGFLLFNLVVLLRTPDDVGPPPAVASAPPPLPAPTPPPQGYVAHAADAAPYVAMIRPATLPRMPGSTATLAVAGPPVVSAAADVVATSASVPTDMDDFARAQMRADEAMRVIAEDTPEMRVSSRAAPVPQQEAGMSRTAPPEHPQPEHAQPVDPAMVDGDSAVPDPADIE
jgi:hypothetical protein